MSKQSCFLGIDIGTTNIKVASFDPTGHLLFLQRRKTNVKHITKGRAEHDAEQIWLLITELIRSIVQNLGDTYHVDAVAVASMGEAGTLIDSKGKILFPIIAWFDSRPIDQVKWWENKIGVRQIHDITGVPLDPKMGVNKLLWIRDQHPEIFNKGSYWLSVADLIVFRLSGVIATDQSLASRTMIFDQSARSWSKSMAKAAGLDIDLFPPVFLSGTKVGKVTQEASRLTGLTMGTPIVLGGHDHLCGAYVARQGIDIAVDATGTAEVVVFPSPLYKIDTHKLDSYISCYADVVPDRYIYSSPVGYAGGLVEWYRNKISCRNSPVTDDMEGLDYFDLIKRIPTPIDFSGIICYPTFGRAIGPNWNPDKIHGALLGLTIDHHVGHIFQALLEGTAFSLRENIEAIEQLLGRTIDKFRVEGGATKNSTWMQLKADITGRTVEAVLLEEAVVLGAALLGGIGVGYYQDHNDAANHINLEIKTFQPDILRCETYNRVYQEIYKILPEAVGQFSGLLKKLEK